MKINSLRNCFLAILFLANFAAFADDTGTGDCQFCEPGDDSGDNVLEGAEVPIDSNILLLGVAGVLVGAFFITNKRTQNSVA